MSKTIDLIANTAEQHVSNVLEQARTSGKETDLLLGLAQQIEVADIESYLLALEHEGKAKGLNPKSLKVKKSNTKTVLMFAKGAAKGQESWTAEQVQAAVEACKAESASLAGMAQAARQSIKDSQVGGDEKEKQIDVMKSIESMVNKMIEAGVNRADIKKALSAVAKVL